jgi:uncharacterized protein YecE (DUF72 family)
MAASVRIGTQGWNYQDWVGSFYPPGTRPADFLAIYARAFDTVEVDSTFYAVPAPSTVRSWAARTPPGFLLSLKLPQEVTHENGLRDEAGTTELFFQRARELGDKLGPTLVQLPPGFEASELPALVNFLPRLPRDLRVAIEFRHRSWMHEGVYALLREYNVALTLVEGRWLQRRAMLALAEQPTADFAYIRWIGPDRELVDFSRVQVDRTRELEIWRSAMDSLAEKVDTIVGYVNNHYSGHSPATVRQLQRMYGLSVVEPEMLGEQLQLFR